MTKLLALFAIRHIWEHVETTLAGVFGAALVIMPMLGNPDVETWRIVLALVIVVGGALCKGPSQR